MIVMADSLGSGRLKIAFGRPGYSPNLIRRLHYNCSLTLISQLNLLAHRERSIVRASCLLCLRRYAPCIHPGVTMILSLSA